MMKVFLHPCQPQSFQENLHLNVLTTRKPYRLTGRTTPMSTFLLSLCSLNTLTSTSLQIFKTVTQQRTSGKAEAFYQSELRNGVQAWRPNFYDAYLATLSRRSVTNRLVTEKKRKKKKTDVSTTPRIGLNHSQRSRGWARNSIVTDLSALHTATRRGGQTATWLNPSMNHCRLSSTARKLRRPPRPTLFARSLSQFLLLPSLPSACLLQPVANSTTR